MVVVLTEAGADPDATTGRYDYTPLHSAAEKGHTETVRALIGAGAQLWDEGHTPLHLATGEGHTETALVLIAAAHTSELNAADYQGRTPLHMAAYADNFEVATALIRAGADPYEDYGQFNSPLEISKENHWSGFGVENPLKYDRSII